MVAFSYFLAILFFHLEQMPTVREYAGKLIIKHILSLCLTIIFVSEFILFYYFNRKVENEKTSRFAYKVPRSYPHIGYQVMSIFVLLYVNGTNLITSLLNSYYLRMCGRYSFGIYLLHPVAIQIFINSRKYTPIKYHRYMFDLTFPKMFIVIGLTYFVALIWFHVLENNLIRIANKIAKWIDLNFNGGARTVLVS
jgi:peptidoglycan/LPS O-acetylase OafA/YrhL